MADLRSPHDITQSIEHQDERTLGSKELSSSHVSHQDSTSHESNATRVRPPPYRHAFHPSDRSRAATPIREQFARDKRIRPNPTIGPPRPPTFPRTTFLPPPGTPRLRLHLHESGAAAHWDPDNSMLLLPRPARSSLNPVVMGGRLDDRAGRIFYLPPDDHVKAPTPQEVFEVRNGILRGRFAEARITPLESWGETEAWDRGRITVRYAEYPRFPPLDYFPAPLQKYADQWLIWSHEVEGGESQIGVDIDPRFDWDRAFAVSMREGELPTFYFHKLKAELAASHGSWLDARLTEVAAASASQGPGVWSQSAPQGQQQQEEQQQQQQRQPPLVDGRDANSNGKRSRDERPSAPSKRKRTRASPPAAPVKKEPTRRNPGRSARSKTVSRLLD